MLKALYRKGVRHSHEAPFLHTVAAERASLPKGFGAIPSIRAHGAPCCYLELRHIPATNELHGFEQVTLPLEPQSSPM